MGIGAHGTRVLILSRVLEQRPEVAARLLDRGCRLVENPQGSRIDRVALVRLLASADALVLGTQRIDAEMLADAPTLRVIVKAGAGVDNIDVDAATARGIRVVATAGANAEAVADYTFGLLLAAARRIINADQSLRDGRWERFTGVDVYKKTLGIIGLGHVGRAVARRASGFAMRVLAVDLQYDQEFLQTYHVIAVDMEHLLAESDFVSLHIPYTPSGGHLFNRETISRMKQGAILINTARGSLVDEVVLYEALLAGRLSGAALDVFEQEPPQDTPLRTLSNVVLSPHNASYSVESMNHVAETAVELLLTLLSDNWEAKRG